MSAPLVSAAVSDLHAITRRYMATSSGEQRAAITNLAHLLHQTAECLEALAGEVAHYAAAEAEARDQLDQAVEENRGLALRIEELEGEREWERA